MSRDDSNNVRIGDWIQTYTGRRFWPLDARPDEVDVRDIAAALSKICRFVGHIREFHSVAAHSVMVAEALPPRLQLLGLLHDASEAYMGDISRPLKKSVFVHSHDGLAYFSSAEANLTAVILAKLAPGLRPAKDDWAEVHRADNAALAAEARDLFASPLHHKWREWLDGVEPLPGRVESLLPDVAEARFLKMFHQLMEATP